MKIPFISAISYRNCKEHLDFLGTQYCCVLSNGIIAFASKLILKNAKNNLLYHLKNLGKIL